MSASIVEAAGTTKLLAIVGTGEQTGFSQRKLSMWTTSSGAVVCETTFVFKIEAVLANAGRYGEVGG